MISCLQDFSCTHCQGKNGFSPFAPQLHSMYLPVSSSIAKAKTINAFRDFSPDRPFGDHALQFTDESEPVTPTNIPRHGFPLGSLLPHPTFIFFHRILKYSGWLVSLNYRYQTFAVTITVSSLNGSAVNICHCCK